MILQSLMHTLSCSTVRCSGSRRYRTINEAHVSAPAAENRFKLLNKAVQRMSRDGLNSLDYELLSRRRHPLYVHIVTRFCNKPERRFRCAWVGAPEPGAPESQRTRTQTGTLIWWTRCHAAKTWTSEPWWQCHSYADFDFALCLMRLTALRCFSFGFFSILLCSVLAMLCSVARCLAIRRAFIYFVQYEEESTLCDVQIHSYFESVCACESVFRKPNGLVIRFHCRMAFDL